LLLAAARLTIVHRILLLLLLVNDRTLINQTRHIKTDPSIRNDHSQARKTEHIRSPYSQPPLSQKEKSSNMCQFEKLTFRCGHESTRRIKHCHFARNDPLHQCFGAWVVKREASIDEFCSDCAAAIAQYSSSQLSMYAQQQQQQQQQQYQGMTYAANHGAWQGN
jgi:hypothetical protein